MWTGMEGADLQVARLLHTEKAIIRACNLAGAPPMWTLRLHTNVHSHYCRKVGWRVYFCRLSYLFCCQRLLTVWRTVGWNLF